MRSPVELDAFLDGVGGQIVVAKAFVELLVLNVFFAGLFGKLVLVVGLRPELRRRRPSR